MLYEELVELYKNLLDEFSKYLLNEFNTDTAISYYIDKLGEL